MKKLLIKIFLVMVSLNTLVGADLKSSHSYEVAIQEGIEQNKSVVLYAHSPFCPWCKKMEEDTLSHPEVIEYLNKNFIFVTVDLSLSMDIEDLPSKFIPQGTPTTYVINPKDEELIFLLRGYKNPASFLKALSTP